MAAESSSVSQQQQRFPQMKMKTISFHMNKIIQNFQINREEWTRGKVAKFIVKAAFWILIYILGSYLTISTSIDLIQQYFANPISLNMKTVMNPSTIQYPNNTQCLYLDVTKAFDGVDAAKRNGSNSSYSDVLEKFFNESTKNEVFQPIKWPKTINGVIIRYLILMYEVEWLRDPGENAFDWLQIYDSERNNFGGGGK